MGNFTDKEQNKAGNSQPPLLPENELYWRDEILQVFYWYRGEGFGEVISAKDLQTFLPVGETLLSTLLERMVEDGYLQHEEGQHLSHCYTFTPYGVREGARRFADEFADLIHQAHGECNDPKCACQTEGPAACTAQTAHRH